MAKPWETPEAGDVAQTADGKLYRRVTGYRLEFVHPKVMYINQDGGFRSCDIRGWMKWCAKAVRGGGNYRRANGEPR